MSETKTEDILRVEGINAKGFGIIPKIVMQDKRLTRDAKAIYAYFKSYAGAGTTAFPSVSKICYDLGFGKYDTYKKHLNLLIKCDYIRVQQERWIQEDPEGKYKKGQFKRNIYTLIDKPNPQIQPNENIKDPNEKPIPQKRVTVKKAVTPKSGDPQKGLPAKNLYNNNNDFKNNSSYNNQSVSPKEASHQDNILSEIDGQTENKIQQLLGLTEAYDIKDAEETMTVHKAVERLYMLKEIKIDSVVYKQDKIRAKLKQLNYETYIYALEKFKREKAYKEQNGKTIRYEAAYFAKILFSAIDEHHAAQI